MIVQASLLSNHLQSLCKSSKGSETKLKSNSKEWVHPRIIFSKVWLRTLMFLLCMSLKSHYIVHIHIVLNFSVFSFACFPYLDATVLMFQASSHSSFSPVNFFFFGFCSACAHNMCYVHEYMCPFTFFCGVLFL